MQQSIKVRELAEQFFKEEINKLDDPQRKEEVEAEEETYIGVWMLGFRAGEQHSGAVWVKAGTRLPDKSGHITWRWIDKTESYAGYDEKKGFIFGTGGARVDPTYYSEIEWLDEGESPSKEGNKDREALANDAVEFAGWILENNIEATFNDKGKLWVDYRLPRGENKFTSAQLHELFKNRNNG